MFVTIFLPLDVDECSNGQSECDAATTTCSNTVGSYRCPCRNGYEQEASTSCTGFDSLGLFVRIGGRVTINFVILQDIGGTQSIIADSIIYERKIKT